VRRALLFASLAGLALAGPLPGAAAEPADAQLLQMKLQSDELALGSATAPVTVVEFTDYQ